MLLLLLLLLQTWRQFGTGSGPLTSSAFKR
jgi:hypothetical protein